MMRQGHQVISDCIPNLPWIMTQCIFIVQICCIQSIIPNKIRHGINRLCLSHTHFRHSKAISIEYMNTSMSSLRGKSSWILTIMGQICHVFQPENVFYMTQVFANTALLSVHVIHTKKVDASLHINTLQPNYTWPKWVASRAAQKNRIMKGCTCLYM